MNIKGRIKIENLNNEAGFKQDPKEVNIQKKILAKQLDLLHKNLFISVPANLICSTVVFIGLYHITNLILIWTWFTAVISISLLRLLGIYFYQQVPQNKIHLYLFTVGVTLSATFWGFADSYLMPQGYLLDQMIIIVIVAGITAGGIQTLQANLAASLLYVTLIVLPLAMWLLLQGGVPYTILGTAMSTYLFFMLSTSWRGYKMLTEAIKLYFENNELIENLSISNKQLQAHDHDISIMTKMNDMLQTCNNSIEAYTIIELTAQELFDQLSGGLSIFNAFNQNMETVKQWGNQIILKEQFLRDDCWSLREGHAYLVKDAKKKVSCPHYRSTPSSSICLPLIIQSGVMGMLNLNSFESNQIMEYQCQLAVAFADVIRLSLANIQLREKLHEQAIRDSLTGIFNRRYLNEILPRILERALREELSLCVCMFDLDHFKNFNDTNGHEAGDQVLQFVGMTLKNKVRGNDIPCRYGGEEFVVVFINTDLKTVISRIQKICNEIKYGRLYYQDKLLQSITVSVGVAQAPIHGNTPEKLIRAADEAMYAAKAAGRDRIEIYAKEATNLDV